MKKCLTCGRELEDGAKFCTSCGAVQNGGGAADGAGAAAGNNGYSAPAYNSMQQPQQAPPMSVGGWIGRTLGLSLISFIPLVGFIIYIIMLVVWMKDRSKDTTFQNWAKAQIVVQIIIFALMMILILAFVVPIIIAYSGSIY